MHRLLPVWVLAMLGVLLLGCMGARVPHPRGFTSYRPWPGPIRPRRQHSAISPLGSVQ